MSQYFDKSELFLEPKVTQYGSHMVMSNVHKPTKTKYVNVDTKFSDEYNDFSVANYNITLPERINDVKSLTVTNLELPMSFYNISSALGNNSFQITNNDVDPTIPYLTQLSTGSIVYYTDGGTVLTLTADNTENYGTNSMYIKDLEGNYVKDAYGNYQVKLTNGTNIYVSGKFVDTIVIPDGYYTIDELKTTINSEIDKLKRIPTNSNGNIVVDANGSIVYDTEDGAVLMLTDSNTEDYGNSDMYIKDLEGNYVKDAYGNYQVKLTNGNFAYVSGNNELKNTNDLRFDYHLKGSQGVQGYFYSDGSQMIIDFTINDKGNFDKYNFKSKLGWMLGYRNLNYTITFNYQPTEGDYDPKDGLGIEGQQLTYGEFLVDLNATSRYVYLTLEEFNKGNQNSFMSPTSSSLINKNIIARISLDRANYSFGQYLPANKQNGLLLSDIRSYSGKIDLQKVNLQIVSDIGTPLPLNGYDFSLCLEIEHD